jgi:hypothetical protein
MTARDLAWLAGAPARAVLLAGIRVYRATLSGWLGGQCRFSPTCSQYAETAVREHGAVKGFALAAWRVARCNPYGRGGIDPVPPGRRSRAYDAVIRTAEEARA